MFASDITAHCGLDTWRRNSGIVHLTADVPEGPYREQSACLAVAHNRLCTSHPMARGYSSTLDMESRCPSCQWSTCAQMVPHLRHGLGSRKQEPPGARLRLATASLRRCCTALLGPTDRGISEAGSVRLGLQQPCPSHLCQWQCTARVQGANAKPHAAAQCRLTAPCRGAAYRIVAHPGGVR